MNRYQWLHKNIGWLLAAILSLVAIIVVVICLCRSIKLDDKINLGDILSNVLSAISLYFTIFILLRLSDLINKSTKESEVEKGLLIERLRDIYDKLGTLNDKIDTSVLDFDDCVREVTRMRRIIKEIIKTSSMLSAITIDQSRLTALQNSFLVSNSDLNNILTYTAPAAPAVAAQISYVTITNNQITVNPQGVAAAIAEIDRLRTNVTNCILLVNKA